MTPYANLGPSNLPVECYRCVSCGRTFVDTPGPTECRRDACQSVYVRWSSFHWARLARHSLAYGHMTTLSALIVSSADDALKFYRDRMPKATEAPRGSIPKG